jgi:plastocyanin
MKGLRAGLFVTTLTLLAIAPVCGADEAASTMASSPDSTRVVIVKIGNFTYEPATVKVSAGTQIKWVNEDDVPHTVTGSDAGSPLHSSALDSEDAYTITIDSAGTYKYFCAIHPHMVGTVVVEK